MTFLRTCFTCLLPLLLAIGAAAPLFWALVPEWTIVRFHRLFELPNHEIENGVLPLRVNEVAQLDNDSNYPEHGKLEIQAKGGR